MDWKLFPPTQASVYSQECSKHNRVSTEQLFHNLDALIRRDVRDCLSKQLQGLLNNNVRIYQVRASFQRRQKIGNLEVGDNVGREAKCNSLKEKHYKQLSMKCPNTKVHKTLVDSDLSRFRCGKSRSAADKKDSFSSKEPAIPRRISPIFSSSKCNNERRHQLTTETNNGDDVLPSNGWWREQGSSDSETEADAEETDCSESFNLDKSGQSPVACTSSESDTLSIFVSEVSENSHCGAKMQARASSCPGRLSKAQIMQSNERNGKREPCNFFQLTSGAGNETESCGVPSPLQTSPVPDDKTCKTCFEDKPPSCFSRPLTVDRDAAIFDDNLKLNYGELLQHRPNTASRINYNTLETSHGCNSASAPSEGRIIKSGDHSERRLEKRNKILCALPNVNNKTRPAGYPDKAVKRRPNKANMPVKLRFQHRSKSCVSGKLSENRDTDERVLPTTLSKSADASYSIMTPYMANIVWSVMDDEKVL